jgi:hypothetical protein
MVEFACRLGLSQKPVQSALVPRQFFWQEFDSHVSFDDRIVSAINVPHPAAAQRSDDSILA